MNAIKYLENKSYTVIAHRYKTKYGEIDVIAKKCHTIVFFEVKYRKKIEQAAYAISERQKQRIINCSKIYIQENMLEDYDFRFDVILINQATIIHLENIIYDDIF